MPGTAVKSVLYDVFGTHVHQAPLYSWPYINGLLRGYDMGELNDILNTLEQLDHLHIPPESDIGARPPVPKILGRDTDRLCVVCMGLPVHDGLRMLDTQLNRSSRDHANRAALNLRTYAQGACLDPDDAILPACGTFMEQARGARLQADRYEAVRAHWDNAAAALSAMLANRAADRGRNVILSGLEPDALAAQMDLIGHKLVNRGYKLVLLAGLSGLNAIRASEVNRRSNFNTLPPRKSGEPEDRYRDFSRVLHSLARNHRFERTALFWREILMDDIRPFAALGSVVGENGKPEPIDGTPIDAVDADAFARSLRHSYPEIRAWFSNPPAGLQPERANLHLVPLRPHPGGSIKSAC